MCKDCAARARMARDALFNAKIGEAVGHLAKGAAEMAGIKEKSGERELAAKHPAGVERNRKPTPAAPGNDAGEAQE